MKMTMKMEKTDLKTDLIGPVQVSTITCTLYTNIKNVYIEKIPIPFPDESCKVSEKKTKFKNCIIFKVSFPSENEKNRNIAFNIFKNGIFNVTGVRSIEEAYLVLNYIYEQFVTLSIVEPVDELVIDHKIRMIVSTFSINNTDFILEQLKEHIEKKIPDTLIKYNTDNHPGLIVKFPVPGETDKYITFIFFGSGKVIVTGANSFDSLYRKYNDISLFIKENKESFTLEKQIQIKIKGKRGRKRKIIE